MPYIKAKMEEDREQPYEHSLIPVVIESDHPRFGIDTRLDWGFVQVAIADGWTVTIEPYEINRSNCSHPDGFDRTGMLMTFEGKQYRLFWCPICHASRGILKEKNLDGATHFTTDYNWDYIEDIPQVAK